MARDMTMPKHRAAVLRQHRPGTVASGHPEVLGNQFKCALVLDFLQTDDIRIDRSIDRGQPLEDTAIGCRRCIRREGAPLEPEYVVTEHGELFHFIALFPVRPTPPITRLRTSKDTFDAKVTPQAQPTSKKARVGIRVHGHC